jgi:hypothetical protein
MDGGLVVVPTLLTLFIKLPLKPLLGVTCSKSQSRSVSLTNYGNGTTFRTGQIPFTNHGKH